MGTGYETVAYEAAQASADTSRIAMRCEGRLFGFLTAVLTCLHAWVWKDLSSECVDVEINFLRAEVFQSPVKIPMSEITAFQRYAARLR